MNSFARYYQLLCIFCIVDPAKFFQSLDLQNKRIAIAIQQERKFHQLIQVWAEFATHKMEVHLKNMAYQRSSNFRSVIQIRF